MKKELVELQIGCKATAVVIFNNNIKELDNYLELVGGVANETLFMYPQTGKKLLKEKMAKYEKKEIFYLVIRGIDEISQEKQNNFIGLVKDREYNEYKLPNNCIIIFSVKDKNSLKNISSELYHLCILAE